MNPLLPLDLDNVGLRRDGLLLIKNVRHRFDDAGISMLLGHNGAGKTLLLKLCHGLIVPSKGRVTWGSGQLASKPGMQAMVFQKPVNLRRSVGGNIEYALKVCGFSKNRRRELLAEALAFAGLEELRQRPARVLSGGEQQRLAIARASAVQPRVLFLDEPCSQLDPGATAEMERLIRAIQQSGVKIIMATHDLGQARRLADDVMFLHRGEVAEQGAAGEFFANPRSEPAQAFLEGRLYW